MRRMKPGVSQGGTVNGDGVSHSSSDLSPFQETSCLADMRLIFKLGHKACDTKQSGQDVVSPSVSTPFSHERFLENKALDPNNGSNNFKDS